jgi:hypothetical protein
MSNGGIYIRQERDWRPHNAIRKLVSGEINGELRVRVIVAATAAAVAAIESTSRRWWW